mgnify:FL=1
MPTLADIAGLPASTANTSVLDGISLLPLLLDDSENLEWHSKPAYSQYPRRTLPSNPLWAHNGIDHVARYRFQLTQIPNCVLSVIDCRNDYCLVAGQILRTWDTPFARKGGATVNGGYGTRHLCEHNGTIHLASSVGQRVCVLVAMNFVESMRRNIICCCCFAAGCCDCGQRASSTITGL